MRLQPPGTTALRDAKWLSRLARSLAYRVMRLQPPSHPFRCVADYVERALFTIGFSGEEDNSWTACVDHVKAPLKKARSCSDAMKRDTIKAATTYLKACMRDATRQIQSAFTSGTPRSTSFVTDSLRALEIFNTFKGEMSTMAKLHKSFASTMHSMGSIGGGGGSNAGRNGDTGGGGGGGNGGGTGGGGGGSGGGGGTSLKVTWHQNGRFFQFGNSPTMYDRHKVMAKCKAKGADNHMCAVYAVQNKEAQSWCPKHKGATNAHMHNKQYRLTVEEKVGLTVPVSSEETTEEDEEKEKPAGKRRAKGFQRQTAGAGKKARA